MEKKDSRYDTARKWLIFWTLFIGIGVILGGIFGVTLMLWICIQFYMFPLNFMSSIYFVFGLCQTITGCVAWKRLLREEAAS